MLGCGAACAQPAETPSPAATDEPAAKPKPKPGQNEPLGTWTFKTERPVKVVVVGGSVSAYYGGNFSDFLEAACPNVEVRNIAKARYGAWAMRKRFEAQVLKNRRLRTFSDAERWILVHGGLNSVGTPEKTNEQLRQLFVAAHGAGYGVAALSLTPWGDIKDRRWRGAKGVFYRRATALVTDFIAGRLAPATALGRYASGRDTETWTKAEQPDVGIDLYDGPLRDRDAALLEGRSLTKATKSIDKSSRWKRYLKEQPEAEREAARQTLYREAANIPTWFMKRELRAFDSIHPNREGHRLMAAHACPRLPESWGCSCDALVVEGATVDAVAEAAQKKTETPKDQRN